MTSSSRIHQRLRLQSAALEAATNSIVITSSDGVIEWVNPAFTELTGYTLDEAVGRSPGDLLKSGSQGPEYYECLWNTILNGQVWRGEITNRRKDGSLYTEVQTVSPVFDDDGNITNFIAIKQDVTENRELQARLQQQAWYDELTGLPNRQLLGDRLEQVLRTAKRRHRTIALLYCGIDRIKMVNTTFGFEAGNAVLQAAAGRLRGHVRDMDTVARVGGDEFAILLPEVANAEDAGLVAERILEAFTQPLNISTDANAQPQTLSLSVSLGLSVFPGDTVAGTKLIQHAAEAMYSAKEEGRNQYRFFTHELTSRAQQRLALYNDLRQAINGEQFDLAYQPIFVANSPRMVGFEALLRWDRTGHGRVSPDTFVPMLEETLMIVPVGKWVLREACARLRSLRDAGYSSPSMAINVSKHQIADTEFVNTVERALTDFGLAPRDLTLEITESGLMSNVEGHTATLKALRELGVRISIDDFGTGYSSLSYLKQLPLDELKIDRSFVQDIPGDDQDEAIVRMILSLAHILDLTVVAEGVETQDQRAFLEQEGCDQIQGFLLRRPLEADDLEGFLGSPTP